MRSGELNVQLELFDVRPREFGVSIALFAMQGGEFDVRDEVFDVQAGECFVQNPLKTSHLCLFRLQTLKIPVNARLRLDKPRNLAKSVTVE